MALPAALRIACRHICAWTGNYTFTVHIHSLSSPLLPTFFVTVSMQLTAHLHSGNGMQVVNKGLRYMLKGESNRLSEYRDELSSFGQYFSERNNVAGATFVYTVYKMTEHILPEQMVNLEGIYLTAFEKMFGLLEDSGWQLRKEPEEGEELTIMEEPSEEELNFLGYTA